MSKSESSNLKISVNDLQKSSVSFICSKSYYYSCSLLLDSKITFMSEQQHHQTLNTQIADIYQSMLNGDKSGLYKLQQINPVSHFPRISGASKHSGKQKTKINTEENSPIQEESNKSQKRSVYREEKEMKASSVVNIGNKKQQMYLNVIKRGPKMGTIGDNQQLNKKKMQKRWANSTNNEYTSQLKQIKLREPPLIHLQHKQAKPPTSHFSVDLKQNNTADVQLAKKNKIYALPKVPKAKQMPKVQSAQTSATKKNFTAQYQSEKVPRKSVKKTQKINFKQMIGKSKRQRGQFQKVNQEELKAQLQLMQYHKSTRNFLDEIKNKYHLNANHQKRLLKRHTTESNIASGHNLDEVPQQINKFKANMQKQKTKCMELADDVNYLKMHFNRNMAALSKLQKVTPTLSFANFLQLRGDSVTQISQEEEQDEVQPLESAVQVKNRYTNLMAHTRDRKWGLMQRTQYENQRAQSLGESRRIGVSRVTQGGEERLDRDGEENKMVINERLKDLLFS